LLQIRIILSSQFSCFRDLSHITLKDRAAELKMAAYDTLSPAEKKMVVDVVEQEYLAYHFINNSTMQRCIVS
jgi:hypothetical protein